MLQVTTTTLPEGQAGDWYATTLAASGGERPYTWLGTMPDGLDLGKTTGQITGTPTSSGSFLATVTVVGKHGHSSAPKGLALDISPADPPPPPPPAGLPWQAGTAAAAYPVNGGNTAADWVEITTPNECNLFLTGQAIEFSFGAQGPQATGYEVTDIGLDVLVSGPLSGDTGLQLASPILPPGAYTLRLIGPKADPAMGNAYGSCRFIVADPDSNFLPPGAYGSGACPFDPPSTLVADKGAWETGSGNGDSLGIRKLFGCGPARLFFPNVEADGSTGAQPTTAERTALWQALAAGYLADLVADVSGGWNSSPVDAAHPARKYIASFPYFAGTVQDVSDLTMVVGILGNRVLYEGFNEPNNAMSPQEYLPVWNAFVAPVQAAGCQALGPCTVTINSPSIEWLSAFWGLNPTKESGISFHPYNCFAGDVSLGDECLAELVSLMGQCGRGSLPLYCTEAGGDFHCDYGPTLTSKQLTHSIVRAIQLEAWDCPLENQVYFFDNGSGFWSQPSSLALAEPWTGYSCTDPNPILAAFRQWSRVRRGCMLSEVDGLGSASDYLRAYEALEGGVPTGLVLFSTGTEELPVTLTSMGSLTAVDVFGAPVALGVDGGAQAIVTVGQLPVYVSSSEAIRVVDVGSGLMSATEIGQKATASLPTPGASQVNVGRLNDGTLWSTYWANSDYDAAEAPYCDTNNVLPIEAVLTWPEAVTIARFGIFCPVPWHQMTSLLEAEVDVLVNGSWQKLWSLDKSWVDIPFADVMSGASRETSYDGERVFLLPKLVSPVTATALRLVVSSTTAGNTPPGDLVSCCPWPQGSTPHLTVQDIRVYSS